MPYSDSCGLCRGALGLVWCGGDLRAPAQRPRQWSSVRHPTGGFSMFMDFPNVLYILTHFAATVTTSLFITEVPRPWDGRHT